MVDRYAGPKFITFEGIDGAGTTTHAKLLTKYIRTSLDLGWAQFTFEPSPGPIGMLTREKIKEGTNIPKEALTLLFAADRIEHYHNVIAPEIYKGRHVICDRYIHSSYAYQTQAVGHDWVYAVNQKVPMPDIVILLTTDVQCALDRTNKRQDKQIYENIEFLTKVADKYLELLTEPDLPFKVIIVDSSGDTMDTHHLIVQQLRTILNDELELES